MKALIGVVIITCLLSVSSKAQSATPAKLHFLNVINGLSKPEIKTANEMKKPILLKSRTWVTIQTAGDSLGLILNGKPYSIRFEPNKEYYFVLQANYTGWVITEKSEREFILTAAVNSAKGPEIYVLSSVTD
ncbi:hypothetical protein [Spirosoma montaniterrae]|uniref:Uncharacterized protein n=1 Tax=Spirosoma montaniterrae TaxID=1178516 RepID=A0A1P9X383_9BACT|nr:hypothetical protein [Spirosoma montaniterrae]AQG82100.1 hypothetical protein AWR27_24060 [Spirosoma montaniterrae]